MADSKDFKSGKLDVFYNTLNATVVHGTKDELLIECLTHDSLNLFDVAKKLIRFKEDGRIRMDQYELVYPGHVDIKTLAEALFNNQYLNSILEYAPHRDTSTSANNSKQLRAFLYAVYRRIHNADVSEYNTRLKSPASDEASPTERIKFEISKKIKITSEVKKNVNILSVSSDKCNYRLPGSNIRFDCDIKDSDELGYKILQPIDGTFKCLKSIDRNILNEYLIELYKQGNATEFDISKFTPELKSREVTDSRILKTPISDELLHKLMTLTSLTLEDAQMFRGSVMRSASTSDATASAIYVSCASIKHADHFQVLDKKIGFEIKYQTGIEEVTKIVAVPDFNVSGDSRAVVAVGANRAEAGLHLTPELAYLVLGRVLDAKSSNIANELYNFYEQYQSNPQAYSIQLHLINCSQISALPQFASPLTHARTQPTDFWNSLARNTTARHATAQRTTVQNRRNYPRHYELLRPQFLINHVMNDPTNFMTYSALGII